MPEPNPQVTVDSVGERIRDSFPGDLGVEPVEVTDEHFVGRMVVDRRHLHAGGLVHGGAWVALADSVGAWQTFRHLPPGVEGAALDEHQDRLQAALEADGDGWLSTTSLRGSTWLRAGIVNTHTRPADIDRLLATLRRLAGGLA